MVKYLFDHHGIKFLLTGSSLFYLKHFFNESMVGRKIVYEMFPLSFGEFLDFRGVPYRQRTEFEQMLFDPYEYERLKGYYDDYIAFGGLPEVVLEPRPEIKREILQEIFSSYINIDVNAMADFRKIGELPRLLQILAQRVGNKLDYSKLSQVIGVTRPTLATYLEFLEKTYVVYRLPAFTSADKATSLGKKLYFRDNGLAGILAQPGDGALFENAIFNQLVNYGRLAYLSKGNEYEVDFIVTPGDHQTIGLEVKLHPSPKDEKKLNRIKTRQGLAAAWIVGKQPTPGFDNFIWGGLIF